MLGLDVVPVKGGVHALNDRMIKEQGRCLFVTSDHASRTRTSSSSSVLNTHSQGKPEEEVRFTAF